MNEATLVTPKPEPKSKSASSPNTKSFPRSFSEQVARKTRALMPSSRELKEGAIPGFMTSDVANMSSAQSAVQSVNGWDESTTKTLAHWKKTMAEQYYVQGVILEWVSHNSKWLNISLVLCMVLSGGTSFGNVVVDTQIHPQISTFLSAIALFFTIIMGGVKAFDSALNINKNTERVKAYVKSAGAFLGDIEAQQSLPPEHRIEANELIKNTAPRYAELCNVPVISTSKQRKAMHMYYAMLEDARKTKMHYLEASPRAGHNAVHTTRAIETINVTVDPQDT